MLVALAAAVPATASASTVPLPLDNDVPPLDSGSGAARRGTDGAARAAAPFVGNGFETFPGLAETSTVRSNPAYTLRLVANGQGDVEVFRAAAVAAAADVQAATGASITVAPGVVADTAPDREPVAGEILLSVDSSSPCDVYDAPWAGCGVPRLETVRAEDDATVFTAGRMWIHPMVLGYGAHNLRHVVEHELGHAVGLHHYDGTVDDQFQVMHPSKYDAATYRSGDSRGLAFLAHGQLPGINADPASGIRATRATLKAKVNPKGLATSYRFEYGPTTGYGTSVPVDGADIGSGTADVPVQQTVTGLRANTTYHYRVVAVSAGGRAVSEDRTFKTTLVPKMAPVQLPDGTVYAFYRGDNDQLRAWLWDGTTWTNPGWGGADAMGGDPTAAVTSDGIAEVLFRTSTGQMGRWRIKPGFYQPGTYGTENVTGTPSAVADTSGGVQVFYRMTTGQLGRWWFNGAGWNWTGWGYATVGGDPDAVVDANGTFEALYRTSSSTTGRWRFPGSGYQDLTYGNADVTGVPSAAVTQQTSINTFYRTSGAQLGRWWFSGSSWNWTGWGYANVAGDPEAVATPGNRLEVLYRTTGDGLGRFWFADDDWHASTPAGLGTVAGEPASFVDAQGNVQAFYGDADGRYHRYTYSPTGTAESVQLLH